MRAWMLWGVMALGLWVPAPGEARECRAGVAVPDTHPRPHAPPATAADMQAHVRACEVLEQRDKQVRAWAPRLSQGLFGVAVVAALFTVVALYRQRASQRRAGRAHVYAFIALHAFAARVMLGVGLAVYRGVAPLVQRGPTRWLWYDQSPGVFIVQQSIQVAIAAAALAAAWYVLRDHRPLRTVNPLPRRGPRRR
ncbi:hypothetical protein [Stenotrophomonas sp. GZD-301]|uniref:hypothetical protein n=1 Tax=Stenotrophomonas sp. GZD-301 TaxID=3404814 RepID=UPI003BB63DC9